MEKGHTRSPEQPLPPQFERMRRGEVYTIPTHTRPLIEREANRKNGVNASVIARLELPSENAAGDAMIIDIVDFGKITEGRYPSILWNSDTNKPLPGWGVANTRFGVDAVNFRPDDRPFGFSLLAPGEVVIGRNERYHDNYLLGLTDQSQETQERLKVVSREHLRLHVSDDEETLSIEDISLNGTSIMLPAETEPRGLKYRAVRALGSLAHAR